DIPIPFGCRTAKPMRAVARSERAQPAPYLIRWIVWNAGRSHMLEPEGGGTPSTLNALSRYLMLAACMPRLHSTDPAFRIATASDSIGFCGALAAALSKSASMGAHCPVSAARLGMVSTTHTPVARTREIQRMATFSFTALRGRSDGSSVHGWDDRRHAR